MYNITDEINETNIELKVLDDEQSFTVTVVAKTLDGINLLIAVYITFALLRFGIKGKKFKRISDADFAGGSVFLFTVVASFNSCLRIIFTLGGEFIFSLYEEGQDRKCDICYMFLTTLHAVSLQPTYLVLWIRQRNLYHHPFMKSIFGPTIVKISKYTGYVIVIDGIWVPIFYFTRDIRMKSSVWGCYGVGGFKHVSFF